MSKPLKRVIGITLVIGGVGLSLPLHSYNISLFPVANSQTDSFASLRAIEKSVHKQINEYRESLGLKPLELEESISEQTRLHSQNMADGEVLFSHNGFEARIEAITAKISSYQGAAENIAFNQGYPDPATRAVESWLDSPGHLNNIKGDFDLTGVGVAQNPQGEYYFTQIFIKQR